MKTMKMWAVISCKTYKTEFGKWVEVDWRRDSDWMCFREANNLLNKLLEKETGRAYALHSEDREVPDSDLAFIGKEEEKFKEWVEKTESIMEESRETSDKLIALIKSEITEENVLTYLRDYQKAMGKYMRITKKHEKLNEEYGIETEK